MTRKSFWTAMSKALTAMTVLTIVTLILATSAAAEYKILYQFKMPKAGTNPDGILTFDAVGNLYGTTWSGGTQGYGSVFKLKPNPDGSWTESVLHSFTAWDGQAPSGGMVFDAAGNLYGMAGWGGNNNLGVVFKLTPKADGAWMENVLHTFAYDPDGAAPMAGLIIDAAGNLYGTTRLGGDLGCNNSSSGCGVVFKLTPKPDSTWNESVLYSFRGGQDGGSPWAGLVFDSAGNLYGTASEGGRNGWGVIFKLTPHPDGTWTESVLHSFNSDNTDGKYPTAGLNFDAAGNLYGTTVYGGAYGLGVVFALKPNPAGTWTESVLHTFTGTDGSNPYVGLIVDTGGSLYGSGGGGTYGDGLVFRLTPTSSGWRETILHTFSGYGAGPNGVVMDAAGTLYGTVYSGGANNGFVYEIMKNCIDRTFVMPYNGTLYLQQKGGSAGATTEFGIGTSPANFVKYYSGLPNNPDPVGEVLVGTFTKGTVINFGMFTRFGSQSGWAFTTGSTRASVVAFSDVDNSLHMGGKILQQTSPTTWLLHLDDAVSVDDDDNDVLMQIRVVPQ